MTDPTPEAIAQAVARVKRMSSESDVLPCAEGLDCNDCRADRAALRLLLTLAADYVPAQDREQALDLAIPDDYEHPDLNEQECSYCDGIRAARRLLKLPAQEAA